MSRILRIRPHSLRIATTNPTTPERQPAAERSRERAVDSQQPLEPAPLRRTESSFQGQASTAASRPTARARRSDTTQESKTACVQEPQRESRPEPPAPARAKQS